MRCYYCGNPADGKDEHAPPKVLFPRDHRIAEPSDIQVSIDTPHSLAEKGAILVVPSCEIHNLGTSAADALLGELCARDVIGGAWSLLLPWYLERLQRIEQSPYGGGEREAKLKRRGFTMTRGIHPPDPEHPMSIREVLPRKQYTQKDWDDAQAARREDAAALDTVLRKIAAAVHYAVGGEPLGLDAATGLKIGSPWAPEFFPPDGATDHETFAESQLKTRGARWERVASGSTQVVYIEHLWNRAWRKRFGLYVQLFASEAQFWIVSK